ncbi:MAG: signal peptidase I [Nitriliruptoraceae bacterium]|jgi:signal peptidase I
MRVTPVRVASICLLWGAAVTLNRALRRVHGASMEPTLHDGDVLLTVPTRHPARGHVVVLDEPTGASGQQVKRVLGLPGEVVRSVQGHLIVDGVGLLEPYAQGRGPNGVLTVPPGHVVVLGDNRSASTDSRTYGPVPLTGVKVRVVARLRPRPRLLINSGPTRLSIAEHDPSSAAS